MYHTNSIQRYTGAKKCVRRSENSKDPTQTSCASRSIFRVRSCEEGGKLVGADRSAWRSCSVSASVVSGVFRPPLWPRGVARKEEDEEEEGGQRLERWGRG